MEAAYQGERRTPSRCGRMDQACAYGRGLHSLPFQLNLSSSVHRLTQMNS